MNILGLVVALSTPRVKTIDRLIPLGGVPLIEHTWNAALQSTLLTRAVLATDDPKIAQAGAEAGMEVPLLLPTQYGTNEFDDVEAAYMVLQHLSKREGWYPDSVALLSPHCPLRTSLHIDQVLHLLETESCDSVVSVTPVPLHLYPPALLEIQDGNLEPYQPLSYPDWDQPKEVPNGPLYAQNGPAILATHSYVLELNRTFFGEVTIPYVMGSQESVQVHTVEDVWLAECILQSRVPLYPPLS